MNMNRKENKVRTNCCIVGPYWDSWPWSNVDFDPWRVGGKVEGTAKDTPFLFSGPSTWVFSNNYLEEDSDQYSVFSFEIPRFGREDVKVTVENSVLKVVAKNDKRNANFEITLTKDKYEQENISAKCENGVLYVKVPKKIKEQPKQIEVKIE